jgi:predicted HTH transcriptional regulator
MTQTDPSRRFADLLIDPRESLDVEIKSWLDLLNNNDDKATLAKALLALANHGGGFLILGLAEIGTSVVPATPRPTTLNAYTQDQINGIVQSYAEPPFHCAVYHLSGPDGGIYPIVVVPGGHRVPVRARRGSPGNVTVQQNAIYVRRPGPKSETPQNAQD